MQGYNLGEDAGSKAVRELGEMEFSGNIIPNLWYHHLRTDSAPNLLAIVLLSELVYWYRPIEVRDPETGMTIGWKKKFEGKWLQISQNKLAQKFGVDTKRIGKALDFLHDSGVIRKKKFDKLVVNGQNWGNVIFVLIVPDRLRLITYPSASGTYDPYAKKRHSPMAKNDIRTESNNLLNSNSKIDRVIGTNTSTTSTEDYTNLHNSQKWTDPFDYEHDLFDGGGDDYMRR